MNDEIPSQAEAERRAEWLHSRGAPHDWIILRAGEVATIKGELATLRAELAEARAEVQKVNEFRERLAAKHRLACDERDAALAKLAISNADNEAKAMKIFNRDSEIARLTSLEADGRTECNRLLAKLDEMTNNANRAALSADVSAGEVLRLKDELIDLRAKLADARNLWNVAEGESHEAWIVQMQGIIDKLADAENAISQLAQQVGESSNVPLAMARGVAEHIEELIAKLTAAERELAKEEQQMQLVEDAIPNEFEGSEETLGSMVAIIVAERDAALAKLADAERRVRNLEAILEKRIGQLNQAEDKLADAERRADEWYNAALKTIAERDEAKARFQAEMARSRQLIGERDEARRKLDTARDVLEQFEFAGTNYNEAASDDLTIEDWTLSLGEWRKVRAALATISAATKEGA